MKNALAVALIDDYVSLGFGERRSPNEMISNAGDHVLTLESSKEEGLMIFDNGDLLETISYDSPELNSRLLLLVSGVLNV